MTITLTAPAEPAPLFLGALGAPATDPVDTAGANPLAQAVYAQTEAALSAVRDVDPQTWLFLERSRYLAEGTCDPYAEFMLRRAGFLTQA